MHTHLHTNAHKITLAFVSPYSYYFKKARLHSQLRTYAEPQNISFLLKFLVEEIEILLRQSLFSKLSDTRGNHLSVFQFRGIRQDSINSFSLDSVSVQDFSLWGTSLCLPIN